MRRGLQLIVLPIGIKIQSISYKIKKVDYNASINELYYNINFSILFLLPLFFFLFILFFFFFFVHVSVCVWISGRDKFFFYGSGRDKFMEENWMNLPCSFKS